MFEAEVQLLFYVVFFYTVTLYGSNVLCLALLLGRQ